MADVADERFHGGRLGSILVVLKAISPPLNFITIHYGYFIVVPLITSLIFWGASRPAQSISYVDSLFLVTSAMTEAGLNTVNLSQMTTFQQILLATLIVVGGQIWVSIWTVQVRKQAFERRFKEIVRKERQRHIDRRLASPSFISRFNGFLSAPSSPAENVTREARLATQETEATASIAAAGASVSIPMSPRSHGEHITFAENAGANTTSATVAEGVHRRHGAHLDMAKTNSVVESIAPEKESSKAQKLSKERRDQLGGTEYRALKLLNVIVPLYFFCWQLFGCVALGAWIANNLPEPARKNAIEPWWNGIFNGLSAFNNSGMSVLDLNMIPYQDAYFVQIVMSAMILAGNTAYPIFLRFGIWFSLKFLNWTTAEDAHAEWKETLAYILKYPRRVYTNMFGAKQTWWLLFVVIFLNGTDWVAYEILNLGNAELEKISVGSRIMNGLFQATAVRSGGFYIVPIPILYIGLQVLYVVMMYISVYPVVITMRHSNIYEERSLGIYQDSEHITHPLQRSTSASTSRGRDFRRRSSLRRALRGAFSDWSGVGAARGTSNASRRQVGDSPSRNAVCPEDSSGSFIRYQVSSQLSHDLWLIVLAVLLIMIIETKHFLEDPITYSVFNILFEVVSAYGCVGISLGVPWDAFSLSGGLYSGSKLVLVLVMIRGRHRGLPVALDRAVQLPSDDMDDVEDQEDLRAQRTMSARGQRMDATV